MKKLFTIVAVLLIASLAFVGCSKKEADASVLTIGATPEPHASMLNLVIEDLAKEGITLKVVEFTVLLLLSWYSVKPKAWTYLLPGK